jgi:hypothetical protein
MGFSLKRRVYLVQRKVALQNFGHRSEPVDREKRGNPAGQKLVGDHADAPNVRSRRSLRTVHHLGGHVLDGPIK